MSVKVNKWSVIRASIIVTQRRQWHPTPVLLPGKSHGRRSLVGCSPWGCKESDTTERLHFHFSFSCIGEGNGSVLAWRIPGTGEPVGLPSMGSHRVRHDWSELAAAEDNSVNWRGGPILIRWSGTSMQNGMATHSTVLTWRTHGQKSLTGYRPWGCKELDTLSN